MTTDDDNFVKRVTTYNNLHLTTGSALYIGYVTTYFFSSKIMNTHAKIIY